jgi:hypothetical protein
MTRGWFWLVRVEMWPNGFCYRYLYLVSFVCWKEVFFLKVNFEENEF